MLENYPGKRIARFQRGINVVPLSLDNGPLVSTNEAKRQLSYTPAGIRYLIKSGKLKASKQGGKWWISQSSIDTFKLEF